MISVLTASMLTTVMWLPPLRVFGEKAHNGIHDVSQMRRTDGGYFVRDFDNERFGNEDRGVRRRRVCNVRGRKCRRTGRWGYLTACRVSDAANGTGAACWSSKPCRASTRARGVANVHRHRHCMAVAMRGCRTPRACRVSDVTNVTSVARYPSETRRAGTHAVLAASEVTDSAWALQCVAVVHCVQVGYVM